MRKNSRWLPILFVAAVALLLPVQTKGEEMCQYYSWTTVQYFWEYNMYACAGWSPVGCTECVNTDDGSYCQEYGNEHCDPIYHGPDNPSYP